MHANLFELLPHTVVRMISIEDRFAIARRLCCLESGHMLVAAEPWLIPTMADTSTAVGARVAMLTPLYLHRMITARVMAGDILSERE